MKVYRTIRELQSKGYASSVKHFPANGSYFNVRYFVGARGITDFADVYKSTPENILNMLPCSADWQRAMLRRVDSVGMIYSLCGKIVEARPSTVPMAISLPRHSDFDAFVTGADGFCIGIMRKGNALHYRDFKKRFWAIVNGRGSDNYQRRGPPLTLVIVPTSFEKKWLSEAINREYGRAMLCAVATEHEALELSPDVVAWRITERQPNDMAFADMIQRLEIDPSYNPLAKNEFKRVKPPLDSAKIHQFDLRSLQKRILTTLADWPLMSRDELGKILNLNEVTRKQHFFTKEFKFLRENGWIEYDGKNKRFVVADKGLRYLAYRDRAAVGTIRSNWGIGGTKITKARKERGHTEKINELVSRIYDEHPGRIEALPDHSTSRSFSVGHRIPRKEIHPDAAILLRLGGDVQSLLLEYEKRADRGGEPLWRKVYQWIRYYAFDDRQFIGNLSQSENPLNLDDEVTLFVVSSDSIRRRMLKRGQDLLKRAKWTKGPGASIPIAITTEREVKEATSFLTDKIWLRMDDFHLQEMNPILSDRRRASPSTNRQR